MRRAERRFPFPLTAAVLAASAGLTVTGCTSSVGQDGGTDLAYLRIPDAEALKKPALNDPISTLLPAGSTRRWEMTVTIPNQAQRLDRIRVGSQKPGPNGTTVVRLDFVQGGKTYREESYAVREDLIQLISAGGDDKMTMSPPMTLVKADLPEGQPYNWEGTILFKGRKAPARAAGRVMGKRKVKTPAGEFDAYRVDTVLTTVIEGRQLTFPSSRWFAPGVGIVKQQFILGRVAIVKELSRYDEE